MGNQDSGRAVAAYVQQQLAPLQQRIEQLEQQVRQLQDEAPKRRNLSDWLVRKSTDDSRAKHD